MKEYRKRIWSPFLKAVKEYNMVEDGDRIAVGVSGGKDSLLLVKLFSELKKDRSRNFELIPISLDPGFKEEDLDNLKLNMKRLDIDTNIFDTNIWEVAFSNGGKNPCFLCAKMRRGVLYTRAEELKCNKLALGHHFDDIIETALINMFYGGTIKTMLPKVKSSSGNFDLIRPMCYVKEKSIISYTKNQGLTPMSCGCSFEASLDKNLSKRKEIKMMLTNLEKESPNIKQSIFSSLKNVNLDYIMGYVGGDKSE